MPDAKLIKQFCLQVNTDLEALTVVLQWFEQIVTPLIPKSVFWQCQVALAEGFTNTVRHAHKNLPPTTTIDLEINVFSSCLEIKIWNWGEPFDLDSALRSLPYQNHNLLDEEGRGLLFMQNLTDELQYIRVSPKSAGDSSGNVSAPAQGRNCLIMRKKISLYSLESG